MSMSEFLELMKKMKIIFLTLVVASVGVSANPVVKTWTFEELTEVIEKENEKENVANEDPEKKPLFDAFERIMYALYTGEKDHVEGVVVSDGSWFMGWRLDGEKPKPWPVSVFLSHIKESGPVMAERIFTWLIPQQALEILNIYALLMSPTGSKLWTIDQLKQAIYDKHTDPDLLPSITMAYQYLINENSKGEGQKKETTEVPIPALDISTWTLHDVLTALKDPQTNRELIPYLKKAQEQFEEAEDKGQKKEYVYLVTPVGLIPRADGVKPTIVHRSTIHEHNNLLK